MKDAGKNQDAKTPVVDAEMFAEFRGMFNRMMIGYESAHRMVADHAERLMTRAEKAEAVAERSVQRLLEIAEEKEALLDRKHKRDLDAAAAAAKQENSNALVRDIRGLGTVAMKKYLGIPLTGNDSHGLQDLLATMTPEQIEHCIATGTLEFSPAQRQALAMILGSLAGLPPMPDASEKPSDEPVAAE